MTSAETALKLRPGGRRQLWNWKAGDSVQRAQQPESSCGASVPIQGAAEWEGGANGDQYPCSLLGASPGSLHLCHWTPLAWLARSPLESPHPQESIMAFCQMPQRKGGVCSSQNSDDHVCCVLSFDRPSGQRQLGWKRSKGLGARHTWGNPAAVLATAPWRTGALAFPRSQLQGEAGCDPGHTVRRTRWALHGGGRMYWMQRQSHRLCCLSRPMPPSGLVNVVVKAAA